MITQSVYLTHDAVHLFYELIMALQWKVLSCFLVADLLHLQVLNLTVMSCYIHTYIQLAFVNKWILLTRLHFN